MCSASYSRCCEDRRGLAIRLRNPDTQSRVRRSLEIENLPNAQLEDDVVGDGESSGSLIVPDETLGIAERLEVRSEVEEEEEEEKKRRVASLVRAGEYGECLVALGLAGSEKAELFKAVVESMREQR